MKLKQEYYFLWVEKNPDNVFDKPCWIFKIPSAWDVEKDVGK